MVGALFVRSDADIRTAGTDRTINRTFIGIVACFDVVEYILELGLCFAYGGRKTSPFLLPANRQHCRTQQGATDSQKNHNFNNSIPNKIIFPLYGVAATAAVARVLQEQSLNPLASVAVGVLIGGGIFYLLFQISSGRWIGGGDVKLGFLLGALVGGPMLSLMVLFLASLLGTVAILPLMLTRLVRG